MSNQKLIELQAWLKNVISAIVSDPDNIEIIQSEDEMGILFLVKVDKSDLGKVIGKEGQVAKALRTLVRSAAYVIGEKVSVKIDAGTRFELEKEDR